MGVMLGLTGKRNVGKSTAADLLVSEFGFKKVHAFDAGKCAANAYFHWVTRDPVWAARMVHGDLKDKPSEFLPGNATPRFYMEQSGYFHGNTLGVDWTLGVEIARVRRESPEANIVIESLVYEADWARAQGALIVRLLRPGFTGPVGILTDEAQSSIDVDATISAPDLSSLETQIRALGQSLVGGR